MSIRALRSQIFSLDFSGRNVSGAERLYGPSVPAGATILDYGFDQVSMVLGWTAGTEWSGEFGFEGLSYRTTFDTGLGADAMREYRHAFPGGIVLPIAARAYFAWRNIDLTDAVLDARGRWWITYMQER